MRKFILIIAGIFVLGAIAGTVLIFYRHNTKVMLTKNEWILWSMKTIDSSRYYTEKDDEMEFRFKQDGSFYYAEKGISKGDINTYEIDGKKIKLHWNGVWIDKMNELIIEDIDTDKLFLSNPNSGQLIPPRFYFFKSGSPVFRVSHQ